MNLLNLFLFFLLDLLALEKLSASLENIRSDFAMEAESEGGSAVGIQPSRGSSASSTNTLNFSLKNFSAELR